MNFDLKKLYDAPKTVKAAFVKGIADGEGCMNTRKRGQGGTINIYNTDLRLIKLCKRLMHDLGIESKKYLRRVKGEKRNCNGKNFIANKNAHILRISRKENLIKFNNKIGFSIGRKQEKLEKAVKSYPLRY